MNTFTYILLNSIMPIFIIISLGFVLGKKFEMNIFTLSRIVVYLLVPAFIFENIFTVNFDFSMVKILLFSVVYLASNYILAKIISNILKYDARLSDAFANSIMFNNIGNIGLPLITLAFSTAPFVVGEKTPYLNEALAALVVVMIFNNVTSNTIGFYIGGRGTVSFKKSIINTLKLPAIHAITLALIIKALHFDITLTPIWSALILLKNGLGAIALIAMGVHLSTIKLDFKDVNVYISSFIRLIIGPLLAMLLIYIFRFDSVVAQTILIAYSVPIGLTTALIAIEYNNNQDYTIQAVVASTLFSTITLPFVIYIAGMIYPA
ncbi:MAG: AEC family transporter [Geosporobacter ferrireducens]|nr:AEC family transporter [Geosporobacter ferrireducens]